LDVVELVEAGEEVVPPHGVVYSQHPRRSMGRDGRIYFVKGPELNVVVPEVISHLLAQYVELRVPEFVLATSESAGAFFFASREVSGFRAVDSWLAAGRVQNPDLVPKMHLLDVLIANHDRNIGNLIGENIRGQSNAAIELVAIDFEKAEALRGDYPLTTVPTIGPKTLRPTGILGVILQRERDMAPHFAAIEKIGRDDVLAAFEKLEAAIGHQIVWKDGSAQLIAQRARDIRKLLAEVWR
jgi:hypothetical protein